MALPHVILACLLTLSAQNGSGQSAPPQARPLQAGQTEVVVLGPDIVSLERIRKLLEQGEPGIRPLRPAPPPTPPRPNPTFRVEIVAYQPKSFEADVKEAMAKPAGSVTAGFFDLYVYVGEHRAGAGAGVGAGGSVRVDPLFMAHWVQRWAYRRAVAKAKEEVERELQALLAAQKKVGEKRD
jgi:hypothetical protein